MLHVDESVASRPNAAVNNYDKFDIYDIAALAAGCYCCLSVTCTRFLEIGNFVFGVL